MCIRDSYRGGDVIGAYAALWDLDLQRVLRIAPSAREIRDEARCETYDQRREVGYQLYNRKAMMKSRNSDIAKYITDFDKFKETGKKKVAHTKMVNYLQTILKDGLRKTVKL